MAKNEQITLSESQIRNIVKASIRESLLKKRAMQRENRINKAVSSVLREMMEEIKPGMSVSHGTGRFIDTIPAMFNVLKQEDPEAAQKILNDNPTFAQMLQKLEDEGESAFNFGQGDPWWESEEAIWVYEDIENELNRLAPEGHYFGSHPGDGSDLGFWPSELDENSLQEDARRRRQKVGRRNLKEMSMTGPFYWSISEMDEDGEQTMGCVEDSSTSDEAVQSKFRTPDEAYADGLRNLKEYTDGVYCLEVYYLIPQKGGDYVSGYYAVNQYGEVTEY